MDTQAVPDHHLTAFGAGDAAEHAKDYTDAAVLMSLDGAVSGRAAIQTAFEGVFAGAIRPGPATSRRT